MSLASTLRDLLVADGGVAALVGTRITPGVLPQNPQLPAVVYQLVADAPVQDVDGSTGLANATYQLDAYSLSYAQADQVAAAMRSALEGVTPGSSVIHSALRKDRREFYEADTKRHRVSVDFSIWWLEE